MYNYTSCQLEVRAYADTICSWNCPSNTSIVNSGGGTANLTPNCTWTSQHKWNSIKFWKYGYTPPNDWRNLSKDIWLWPFICGLELWWRRWYYICCLDHKSMDSIIVRLVSHIKKSKLLSILSKIE